MVQVREAETSFEVDISWCSRVSALVRNAGRYTPATASSNARTVDSMARDPRSNRTEPAPAHPAGLKAVEDGPVFIAPAVDVRPAARAQRASPPPPVQHAAPEAVSLRLPYVVP